MHGIISGGSIAWMKVEDGWKNIRILVEVVLGIQISNHPRECFHTN
jgi:hypothetical protein